MSVVSPRTRRILEAPVLPLLFTLALPNIGEAAARITFLTADAFFVSWLGSDALAAAAIVFPLFLILQTATASGIGSGVSSAIGRALGAGDHERARSLAGVAVVIALLGAVATTALMVIAGPALYDAMGLASGALDMAVLYNPGQSSDLEMSTLDEDELSLISHNPAGGKKGKGKKGNSRNRNNSCC